MRRVEKRSQIERITIAESLADGVWQEVMTGKVQNSHGLAQEAVYLQTAANRIVWKLNEMLNAERRSE